jgi:hypothetical protein
VHWLCTRGHFGPFGLVAAASFAACGGTTLDDAAAGQGLGSLDVSFPRDGTVAVRTIELEITGNGMSPLFMHLPGRATQATASLARGTGFQLISSATIGADQMCDDIRTFDITENKTTMLEVQLPCLQASK